jgi:hypothetical protein
MAQEIVEPRVLSIDLGHMLVASGAVAVEDHAIAGAGELAVGRAQHRLDRMFVRVATRDRAFGEAILEIAHDDHAFLQRLAIFELERGQSGGAPRLSQQPVGTRLGNVDLMIGHDAVEPLEVEQKLDPLGKGAARNMIHPERTARGFVVPAHDGLGLLRRPASARATAFRFAIARTSRAPPDAR